MLYNDLIFIREICVIRGHLIFWFHAGTFDRGLHGFRGWRRLLLEFSLRPSAALAPAAF
jgi:hypothetical protein